MNRLLEILFGLQRNFLHREGELHVQFTPRWPGQDYVGATTWNLGLIAAILALLIYVYRREGRSRGVRVALAVIRGTLLAFLLAMLNRPVLTLSQSLTEPSVLAVMIDDSVSMRVPDIAQGSNTSRLAAATTLLSDHDQALLKSLAEKHTLRFYRFDGDAYPVTTYDAAAARQGAKLDLSLIKPQGQTTQLFHSIQTVLQDLQGQRLAGVVVLTDGRETPAQPVTDALTAVKNFGVKVFPIPLGSDRAPRNIRIESVTAQDSAFKGDIVNVHAEIRGTGFEPGHPVNVTLKDRKTGVPILDPTGKPVAQRAVLADSNPVDVELQFRATAVGPLDLLVEAAKEPGETDEADNIRDTQVAVLDAKIAVLYVDGYPRWEYRYIKNEMIRDPTVDISCLLTSADPNFAQEGDRPIRRFPESIEELMSYDVVFFGDVDPRQFTDHQLQLVSEFVAKRGGGFGMAAGPKWSPGDYRNTSIEPMLPVTLTHVRTEDPSTGGSASIRDGFRPVITKPGAESSIYRFLPDRTQNENFLKNELQPLFWYCHGAAVKPGVGETLSEHPADVGPDGRHSPILIIGRYGAGRTLFSSVDETWRWRFYTGESVFDSYWVQQFRYLARSKKLGQRLATLVAGRPTYEVGEQIRVNLRILDPKLLEQLPDQLRAEIDDPATGQTVRSENLIRQEGSPELYTMVYPADRVGRFTVRLPALAGSTEPLQAPVAVEVPRLELEQPQVDRTLLTRLASETLGQTISLAEAPAKLPTLIPSAARIIPLQSSQPLWNAPLPMALFVLLITAEWVTRKAFGML